MGVLPDVSSIFLLTRMFLPTAFLAGDYIAETSGLILCGRYGRLAERCWSGCTRGVLILRIPKQKATAVGGGWLLA
jgi:hypothetical protein